MELRVLHYFLTIAREGSLIGAAKALNLTQPTLSRQMKELEDELGQKLLIRSAQGMLLTSEGLILRKRAEEIMELVEKTKTEFHSAQKDISGEIYIGGGETRGMRADCPNNQRHTKRLPRHSLSSLQRQRRKRNRTLG